MTGAPQKAEWSACCLCLDPDGRIKKGHATPSRCRVSTIWDYLEDDEKKRVQDQENDEACLTCADRARQRRHRAQREAKGMRDRRL